MIILDSSVLIELFRKKNKKKTFFYLIAGRYEKFAISVITYYEIGIGNRESHSDYWELLCNSFDILPFDKLCSDSAIEIYSELRKTNQMIDMADVFIGATARAYSFPVATLNVKHFKRINDLEIIDNG